MSYIAVTPSQQITANGIVLVDYPETIKAKINSNVSINITLKNTDSVDHNIYIKILDSNGNTLASTTDTLSSGEQKQYSLTITAPSKVSSFTLTLVFGVNDQQQTT